MHRATKRFWHCFNALQPTMQELARKNFALLKANHRHPSLHFKNVGDFWSARVGTDYRALAVEDDNDFIWVWIGHHKEYDRLIR